jgi:hypothetical protein
MFGSWSPRIRPWHALCRAWARLKLQFPRALNGEDPHDGDVSSLIAGMGEPEHFLRYQMDTAAASRMRWKPSSSPWGFPPIHKPETRSAVQHVKVRARVCWQEQASTSRPALSSLVFLPDCHPCSFKPPHSSPSLPAPVVSPRSLWKRSARDAITMVRTRHAHPPVRAPLMRADPSRHLHPRDG